MTKLAKCVCGKRPKRLHIMSNSSTHSHAFGDCWCPWEMEFNSHSEEVASKKCMELAIEAWNEAPRPASLVCEDCHKPGEDVKQQECPCDKELHNRSTLVVICDDCRRDRAQSV